MIISIIHSFIYTHATGSHFKWISWWVWSLPDRLRPLLQCKSDEENDVNHIHMAFTLTKYHPNYIHLSDSEVT